MLGPPYFLLDVRPGVLLGLDLVPGPQKSVRTRSVRAVRVRAGAPWPARGPLLHDPPFLPGLPLTLRLDALTPQGPRGCFKASQHGTAIWATHAIPAPHLSPSKLSSLRAAACGRFPAPPGPWSRTCSRGPRTVPPVEPTSGQRVPGRQRKLGGGRAARGVPRLSCGRSNVVQLASESRLRGRATRAGKPTSKLQGLDSSSRY